MPVLIPQIISPSILSISFSSQSLTSLPTPTEFDSHKLPQSQLSMCQSCQSNRWLRTRQCSPPRYSTNNRYLRANPEQCSHEETTCLCITRQSSSFSIIDSLIQDLLQTIQSESCSCSSPSSSNYYGICEQSSSNHCTCEDSSNPSISLYDIIERLSTFRSRGRACCCNTSYRSEMNSLFEVLVQVGRKRKCTGSGTFQQLLEELDSGCGCEDCYEVFEGGVGRVKRVLRCKEQRRCKVREGWQWECECRQVRDRGPRKRGNVHFGWNLR